jgi:TetR/AcrR family acrAB operon transcriptional repressor
LPSAKLFITLFAEAVEPDSVLHKWHADLHKTLRDQVRSWVEQVELPSGVGAEELSTILVGAIMGIRPRRLASEDQ